MPATTTIGTPSMHKVQTLFSRRTGQTVWQIKCDHCGGTYLLLPIMDTGMQIATCPRCQAEGILEY
jgi:uncharacterized paraquat-inducible protein A